MLDVGLSLPHEEKIEGTIHSECEDEPGREYSEDRDRDIGEEFPHDSWQEHHRDEDHDRGTHSRDDGDRILSECEHDSRARRVANPELRTRSLYDHDDRIDRYPE